MKINLKKIRENKKISQSELAKMAGTKQSYISEIEANKKIPSLYMLQKIANALEVCVPLLISDEKINCDDCLNCIRKTTTVTEKHKK